MFTYFSDIRNSWRFQFYCNNPTCLYHHNKGLVWFVIGIILIRNMLITPIFTVGSSMQPSRFTHDFTYVNRVAYDLKLPFLDSSLFEISSPKRGDVVSVNGKEKQLLKRIIGLPGDHIKITNSVLFVNGKALKHEPFEMLPKDEKTYGYSKAVAYSGFWETNGDAKYQVLYASETHPKFKKYFKVNFSDVNEITVPDNSYYVLGDNRVVSRDSRSFGVIKRDNITGRVPNSLFNYKALLFWKNDSYPQSTL